MPRATSPLSLGGPSSEFTARVALACSARPQAELLVSKGILGVRCSMLEELFPRCFRACPVHADGTHRPPDGTHRPPDGGCQGTEPHPGAPGPAGAGNAALHNGRSASSGLFGFFFSAVVQQRSWRGRAGALGAGAAPAPRPAETRRCCGRSWAEGAVRRARCWSGRGDAAQCPALEARSAALPRPAEHRGGAEAAGERRFPSGCPKGFAERGRVPVAARQRVGGFPAPASAGSRLRQIPRLPLENSPSSGCS